MGLAKIMSPTPVSVEMDDSIELVKETFDTTGFHHVLVVHEDRLLGIVSDRDLLKALSPTLGTAAETFKDLAILNKKVHQIMTRKPVTVDVNASVYDAIDLFNEHRLSCLPVMDENNVAVGILSWRDVFQAIAAGRKQRSTRQD